jgi:hypothetical protein
MQTGISEWGLSSGGSHSVVVLRGQNIREKCAWQSDGLHLRLRVEANQALKLLVLELRC